MSTDTAKVDFPFEPVTFGVRSSCEIFGSSVNSEGLFREYAFFKHPIPFLMLLLGVTLLVKEILRRILRPLNQPRFVAEILVIKLNFLGFNLTGILLGPSIIKLFHGGEFYAHLFTFKQDRLLSLLETLTSLTYTYIVGIRTDIRVVKDSGLIAWIVGVTGFVVPISVAYSLNMLLKKILDIESIANLSPLAASTTFHVTCILLDDLKLLNSEIGRLALSSSVITSFCSVIYQICDSFYIWISLPVVIKFEKEGLIRKSLLSRIFLVLLVVFVLRPIIMWMIRKIPEGKDDINESHFLSMVAMLFGVGFVGELLGLSATFGAMTLGLVVPPGPPLGSGMVKKLSLFISAVLVPSYIVNVGRFVDVSAAITPFTNYEVGAVILILGTFLGKIGAGMLPLRLFGMPYKDGFTFGLIVGSQGIFDVLFFKRSLRSQQINGSLFSVITTMAMLSAAIATPIIGHLYDPSKRYINYRRRTIQHLNPEKELRLVLCVHEEDDVLNLMNVLKAATYPTEKSPLGVYVLDLMELVGRDQPILINHRFHKDRSSTVLTRTDRIINAFRQFEAEHEGIKHQHFTAIAPYASMHDDICTLALQESASLLIIPFHNLEGNSIRGVKKNVLDKAPCSVGILVNKKIAMHWRTWARSYNEPNFFNVCVIFLGGPDSREALSFGMRLAGNPTIKVTVIRLIAEEEFITDLSESRLDVRMITELRNFYEVNQRIEYKEMLVQDGAKTMEVLRSLDIHYDLILVGRRLDSDSPLVDGLVDWSYNPELGIVGDILASSDMKNNASVLVLQQQSTVEDLLLKKKS